MQELLRPTICLVILVVTGLARAAYAGPIRPGCRDYEAVARADPATDFSAMRALDVWDAVRGPYFAVTGIDATLEISAPGATFGDPLHEFPPDARTCDFGVVRISHALVERICFEEPCREGAYPVDFLAFVFAHELAHLRAASAGGGFLGLTTLETERQADRAAAWFMRLAHYSVRRIAREDLVAEFLLRDEALRDAHVRPEDVADRRAELLVTLRDFDAYEGLYEAGTMAAFAGDLGTAARLFAWADQWLTVPEVRLFRATVLMLSAAADAPWIGGDLPIAGFVPRCLPVFPGHSVLWEPGERVQLLGAGDAGRRSAARRALEDARILADQARSMGAAPLAVESLHACLSFYLGDVDDAGRHADAAERGLMRGAPESLRSTLRANRALFALARFMRETPPPADRGGLAGWAAMLRAAKLGSGAEPDVAAFVKALGRLPARTSWAPDLAPGLACRGDDGASAAVASELQAVGDLRPALPIRDDSCPAGWTTSFTYPDPESAEKSGTAYGVVGCSTEVACGAQHLVRVRLPARTEGDLPEVDEVFALVDLPPSAAPAAATFACGGGSVRRAGTSVGGATAFSWSRGITVPLGLLYAAPDGTVRRAVSVTPL